MTLAIRQGDWTMQTIERLIRNLGESDRVIRCNALWSLQEMGTKAKPALPAIKPILHDNSEPYLQIVCGWGDWRN